MQTWDDVIGIKPKEEYKCPHFFKKENNTWKCIKCSKDPREIFRIS